MDILTLLNQAGEAGLVVHRKSNRLEVRGPSETESIVNELRERKGEILAAWWCWQASRILRQIDDPDVRSELQDAFDEVAASREHEHDLNREDAEHVAFGALVAECLRRGLPVTAIVDRRTQG